MKKIEDEFMNISFEFWMVDSTTSSSLFFFLSLLSYFFVSPLPSLSNLFILSSILWLQWILFENAFFEARL